MIDAGDIVLYERIVARSILSIGALLALWASYVLARRPLQSVGRLEAHRGGFRVVLEDFSPAIVFLSVSGMLFYFSAQPIDVAGVMAAARQ